MEYASHFYQVSTYQATYSQALADAVLRTYRGMRGHLVTLVQLEEAGVAALLNANIFWVAATDISTEGTWMWTAGPENGTGAVMQWNTGEPNGLRAENCVQFLGSTHRFNDFPCNASLSFVIEFECDLASSIDLCQGM